MSDSSKRRQEFTQLYDGCEVWLYSYLLSLLRRPSVGSSGGSVSRSIEGKSSL